METLAEREERIARLEQQRERRADSGGTVWPTPDDAGTGVIPLEIAPGRGDLNYSSGFVPTFPTALYLVGNRAVSFARLFMSQPWIAASVMWMMTRSIRVPLKVYRRLGDDPADRIRLRPQDHPLAAAAVAPYDHANQAQFVMNCLGPLMVHGNAVQAIESGAGESIQFVPQDWRFTRPIMPFRDALEGFQFNVDSPSYQFERSIDEVLHVAYWSPTGPIGCSPLQQLGVTIQIEDAAQRFQRALFQNGTRPPSAITVAAEFLGLKPQERQQILKQLREDLASIYSGPDQAGKPALLPPGLDWKPIGQTTVEAELIDQRKITREEIAAVFQVPAPLLGILDRATYSNIEILRDLTYTDCLGPPLILVEQAMTAQVARDLLKEPDIECEFDFGAVLRGDRLEEIASLRDAIGSALLTPNEGRGVINMSKSDNPAMDEFFLPFNNLQPVGQGPVPHVPPPASGSQQPAARRLHVRSRDRDYEHAVA